MSNNIPEFPQPPHESSLPQQGFQPQNEYTQQSYTQQAPNPPQFTQPQYTQPQYRQQPYTQPQFAAQPQYAAPTPTDSGSFGWAVLGFFFPLVGLILFLVWKDSMPLSAKKAGIGALVGVISEAVLAIAGIALFMMMLEIAVCSITI